MSTDVLPETQRPSSGPSRSHTPLAEHLGDSRDSSRGRWWWRGLLAIGLLTVIGSAAALIPGALSSRETGPKLTHTITRGDLLVTVTEQGTLESSNNAEIKCKVRGFSTVTWVVPGGTVVAQGDELVRLDTKVIEEEVSLTKTN